MSAPRTSDEELAAIIKVIEELVDGPVPTIERRLRALFESLQARVDTTPDQQINEAATNTPQRKEL